MTIVAQGGVNDAALFCGNQEMGGDLGDLLLLVFDFAVHYGLGQPQSWPASTPVRALIEQTLERWHTENAQLQTLAINAALPTSTTSPSWLPSRPSIEAHNDPSH